MFLKYIVLCSLALPAFSANPELLKRSNEIGKQVACERSPHNPVCADGFNMESESAREFLRTTILPQDFEPGTPIHGIMVDYCTEMDFDEIKSLFDIERMTKLSQEELEKKICGLQSKMSQSCYDAFNIDETPSISPESNL